MAEKNNSFEADLKRLEEIVSQLEKGECSLDDSVKLFEEGIEISNRCNNTLKEAKLKITALKEKDNGENNEF